MRRTWFSLVAALAVAGFVRAEDGPSVEKLGKSIDAVFTAPDGSSHKLHDLRGEKATVVVFLSFDCPNSNGYVPTLTDLHAAYAKKGVAFVAVCETDLTAEEIKQKVADFKLPFPVFADPKQATADAFKAHMTPEAFVLDRAGVLQYRGRIDNRFAARLKQNPKVTDVDVQNALDDVLAGRLVRTPATKAIGCMIPAREPVVKVATTLTYYKDVLPVLQTNCQTCHRPGEAGPFSLLTYKQATAWAEDIKETATTRKMPPWKPAAGLAFQNERRLSDADISLLSAWVDGGTPEGDKADAPPPVKYGDGWALGKPDLILTASEDFNIGASGSDAFRCFVLPTDLPEDQYIVGFEVKPGNPQVVHHTLNYWDITGKARTLQAAAQAKAKSTDRDRGPGYPVAMGLGFIPTGSPRPGIAPVGGFGGWAPGQVPRFLPEGTGYFFPKGADVILQVHYHRNGRPATDRTRVGLSFAKKPVERPFQAITVGPRNPFFIFIPPGKEDHKISGALYLQNDATLHSVMPHMHLIGKSVKATVTPPDGLPITLVDIPEWDYNWQETYWLKEPMKLQAGTKLEIEALYDNSTKNPNNPKNPPAPVHFGEETTNEMLFGFFGMTNAEGRRVIARPVPLGAKK